MLTKSPSQLLQVVLGARVDKFLRSETKELLTLKP